MSEQIRPKHACALARADRGQWLTEAEKHALMHHSRWGSDGYPIHKLGSRWDIDTPINSFPLFATKRAAVARWEDYIDILIDLSGIEAYNRAIAEAHP